MVFADGSWKNEHAYYNASNSKLTVFEEGYYKEEDITRINEEIHLKISMSNSAIKNNYFGYLEKALNNQKIEMNALINEDNTKTNGS